jgi:hypothetical protein
MGEPQVVFDPGYTNYDMEDICSFLDWKEHDVRNQKLFKSPRVAWKVTISGYAPDRISVSKNKEIAEKDLERPDEDTIRQLHKKYLQQQKCLYLYLDANGEPLFFGDKNAMVATDENFYDTLPNLTVDDLSDFVKDLNKNVKEFCFVGPSSSIHYARKVSLPRLFYPFLLDYIEERYPTLREPGEAQQFISESALRILLTFFISWKTGIFLPMASCSIPESYLFAVSLDGYLDSPFGVDGLPPELTKDFTKMMPKLPAVNKPDVAASSPAVATNVSTGKSIVSNPSLIEVVKHRASSPISPFYNPEVITDTNIKDSIDTFVSMSWVSFIACAEQIKIGCSIFLAPGEVVLDDAEHILFSEEEFPLIFYHGPEFELAYKKNTIDVCYTGNRIDTNALANLREYFMKMFNAPIQSVTPVSDLSTS